MLLTLRPSLLGRVENCPQTHHNPCEMRKSKILTFFFLHFQVLDLNLKWPNDIYAHSDVKIGGLIVNSLIEGDQAICNVGECP